MKRTVAILVTLVLLLSLTVPLFAVTVSGKLVLGNAEFLETGEVKTIPISIENVESISVIQLVVEYDHTKLELQNVENAEIGGKIVPIVKDAEKGTILEGKGPQITQPEEGKVSIIWESESDIEGNGVITNLTFKALEEGIGQAGVVVSKDPEDEFIFKADSQDNVPSEDIVGDIQEEPMVETKYTVSFDAGKGTGAPDSVKSILGKVTIPETVPVRTNWEFLYWFDDSGSYNPGNTYSLSEDKALTAKWSPDWNPEISLGTIKCDPGETVGIPVDISDNKESPSDYSIEFTAGKAEFVSFTENENGIPVSGQMGIAYFKIPADAKDGDTYTVSATVEKWTVDGDYEFAENIDVTEGNITVERSQFNITYDANGGNTAPDAQIKKRDVDLIISDFKPFRQGHKFLGWATDANASEAQYQPGETYTANEDIAFYAVWEELPVARIIVGEVKGRAGKEVEILVSLENNPGISSMKLMLDYDEEALTYVSSSIDSNFEGLTETSEKDGKIVLNWALSDSNSSIDGTFAVIKFVVKEDAETGKKDLVVSYNSNDVCDKDLNNIAFVIDNGSVNVIKYIPGDINDDGEVNNKDVMTLFYYLSGMNYYVVEDALDVNADGEVNNKDVMTLFYYLSGMDYEIY